MKTQSLLLSCEFYEIRLDKIYLQEYLTAPASGYFGVYFGISFITIIYHLKDAKNAMRVFFLQIIEI